MLKRLWTKLRGQPEQATAPIVFDRESFPVKIEIRIGDMYREAYADIEEVIATGRDPDPTTQAGLSIIFKEYRRWVKPEDQDLICSKWSTAPTNHMRRAMIFDLLRRWYTERQRVEHNQQPMYLHLLKDPGWED